MLTFPGTVYINMDILKAQNSVKSINNLILKKLGSGRD